MKIKNRSKFGGWRLVSFCGRGGSSVVWKATDSSGRIGAMKFVKRSYFADRVKYARFSGEVAAMKACADIVGVLPLWDASVPDAPRTDGDAWLVSPLAIPLTN